MSTADVSEEDAPQGFVELVDIVAKKDIKILADVQNILLLLLPIHIMLAFHARKKVVHPN